MRQDDFTLPPGDEGWFADRLAGLHQVIPLGKVRQVLLETDRVNQRACKLTHEVTLRLLEARQLAEHRRERTEFADAAVRLRPPVQHAQEAPV